MTSHHHNHSRDYLPAAGYHFLLPLYDPTIRFLSRERKWRGEILKTLALSPGDVLIDVGCGTGTLAVMAKASVPSAEVIGIDPDPNALQRARKKAKRKGLSMTFEEGFGGDTARLVGESRATKIVSTLAFHHMSKDVQAETLAAMTKALRPGGLLRVADFTEGHMGHGSDVRELITEFPRHGLTNPVNLGSHKTLFGTFAIVGATRVSG
jgi:FkbM family methyltransferase